MIRQAMAESRMARRREAENRVYALVAEIDNRAILRHSRRCPHAIVHPLLQYDE